MDAVQEAVRPSNTPLVAPVVDDSYPDPARPVPTVMTISVVDPEQEQAEYQAAAELAFQDEPFPSEQVQSLSHDLLREFNEAEQLRQPTEERWLKDLRQYRGIYDAETLSKLKNRSKAFVRRTRVKVKTVDSRFMDLVFPAGREKNWTCEETPVPAVSKKLEASAAQELQQKLERAPNKDEVDKHVLEIVKQAAKRMSKVMEDQLVEVGYKGICKKAAHSAHLYGTGVIKGPLVDRKVRTRYTHDEVKDKWVGSDEEYTVPFVDFVPIWRFYPDMRVTEKSQCRFIWERHTMPKHDIVALTRRRSFDKAKIVDYLTRNPRGQVKIRTFDTELLSLGERDAAQVQDSGMYEVLERWGWLDGYQLAEAGVQVEPDRMHETFFSNVWMLMDGTIIKCVLQPINGVTWPYHIYDFDKDETSIFGEGLASIMRSDQDMLNASVRMALDNGALTAGPIIEVALGLLASTENAEQVMPWKVYLRKSTDMDKGPAVRAIELPNQLEWLTKMISVFENNTDEVTAVPRYMTGENATQGAAGTATGMSMLMGAANIVYKDLVDNWDEGVTNNFIQALYRWNMQFHRDNSIKGDYDVKARGSKSLVAKEILAAKLNEFGEYTKDPADAPFVNRHKLNIARAEALELPELVYNEDEWQAMQESEDGRRMQEMQRKMQEAQLAEQMAKAAKLQAEAEVAKKKVDEMIANIDKIIADTVSTKVETIFAALQAGGAATRDPVTAPAGDAILRDAGYREAVPDPSTADLNRPPVQVTPGTHTYMSGKATFQQEPRGTVQAPGAAPLAVADPAAAAQPQPADPNVGQRAGIETVRQD